MKRIDPELFGSICGFVATQLSIGKTQDQALQAAILKFRDCDGVDVEEVVETAVEGWKRLQCTEA